MFPLLETVTQKLRSLQHGSNCIGLLTAAPAVEKTIEAKAPPPVVLPPPRKEGLVVREQIVEVTTTNGHSDISIKPNADHWCKLPQSSFDCVHHFTRRFRFYSEIVPDCLAWVLTHDGITYEAIQDIEIDYRPDEFKRLCELQLASNSDQLIDGQRYGYYRRILDP